MHNFWYGFLAFPLLCTVLGLLAWLVSHTRHAFIKFYCGLPPVKWLAMFLIVLGVKFLRTDYCRMKRAEGYIWFSPKTDFFIDKKAVR